MKTILSILIILFSFLFENNNDFYHITIQPYDNFSEQEINNIKLELEKIICSMTGQNPTIDINKNKKLENFLLNDSKIRYRADKIIRSLSGNENNIIIALTHSDISIPYKGRQDWGVLGLYLRPGYVCVASDYRLKYKKRDFWKVILHEYIHTRYNYSHCPKDNSKCIMKDAKGHADFSNKNDLCGYCKNKLKLK